ECVAFPHQRHAALQRAENRSPYCHTVVSSRRHSREPVRRSRRSHDHGSGLTRGWFWQLHDRTCKAELESITSRPLIRNYFGELCFQVIGLSTKINSATQSVNRLRYGCW